MSSNHHVQAPGNELAARVAAIESVEDLFAVFKLDFDRHAIDVYRLHILRHFGQLVEAIEARSPAPSEQERPVLYASALLQAHDRFALGECCREPPVFAGLRQGLVQLGLKRRIV